MSLSDPATPRLLDRRTPVRSLMVGAAVALVLGAAFLAFGLEAQAYDEDESSPKPTAAAWPEETVYTWSITPVQDGGRVKPFYTWARYALMRMNDSGRCAAPNGEKLSPVEWALDVLFRPEVAVHYDCFLVETDEILVALELDLEALRKKSFKKKRDRYSYAQLAPARAKLEQLGREYGHKEKRERTVVEGGIVDLYHAVLEYEGLLHYLDMSRKSFEVPEKLRPAFGGAEQVPFSAVVEKAPELVRVGRATAGHGASGADSPLNFLQGVANTSNQMLAFFPPTLGQVEAIRAAKEKRQLVDLHPEEWLSAWDVIARPAQAPQLELAPAHVAMLGDLERMASSADDAQAFQTAAQRFQEQSKSLAIPLGEYENVELEVAYFNWHFFHTAFGFFILAFVLVAVSWLWPNRWISWGAFGLTSFAVLVTTIGIVVRCVLKGRPPVTTLYETVLFITASGVIALLAVELMNRRRIALALAPVIGILGLLLAFGYEGLDKRDTMGKLVAVLDTDFWLTLHVICISIGYMGGLVTGAIGHVYVLGKVTGFRKQDPEFYRTLSRMLYGTLAFGLIFATVGTILGGIWANESWGRFWGWDPKENGALIIVLWQLGMVHARLGGYIKVWGLAVASVVLTPIVAFSWWHVNHLGIGLHSYGFTGGILETLKWFYIVEAAVLTAGAIWWFNQRQGTTRSA